MNPNKISLKYFPFAVDLEGKQTLVVGGGKIAERKALALLEAKAYVRVVSPTVTDTLRDMIESSQIKWKPREIEQQDLRDVRLIIAATNNRSVNEKVSRWAHENNIWINVVDKPALSDFISPAVFFAQEGIVAVYSDGKDPVLSRDLKNFIKDQWNEFLSYRNKSQISAG